MAKYSTGSGGGGGSGDACELCGREDTTLSRANVAGAELLVCSDCAPHDDDARSGGSGRGGGGRGGDGGSGSRDQSEPNRKKRAAQNVAKAMDASTGDSRHWEEEGTDYEEDRLPYLVKGYGEVVTEARQGAEMTAEELADEIGVETEQIHAVEEGRAARAGVGGSTVRSIEQALDVTLVDE
ncbi:multiprotein-bridging factor 1 family protein [Halobaculum halobium]|uniref:Multiprotein-bridging factor 1 family protein n=1 Tax=Halobaculum halobium TaxID=3032281 RepID=A0ABD5T818_9EURY|nr:transcriptional regulator [Halobaculum sp. SYNS20]